jgi:tripartite-type tricarboxylate transporter receptor subunit TctC
MHTGVADGYTRLMVGKMAESIGQPIVVDQRLGAGGAIAAEAVARAAPDGYTLLASFPDAMVNRHTLVKNVPYDTVRDFTAITQLADPNIILAVAPGVANDLKDYLAKAKAQPGKIGYGSLGIGSSFHFAGEALKQIAGVDLLHVPFKQSADAVVAVQRGDLASLFTAQGVALPQHRAGKLRIIAMVNDRRSPAMPDVPAIREVVQGFESPPYWLGYFGPAQLPRPVVQRLNAEFVKAAKLPEIDNRANEIGFTTIGSSADEFSAKVKRDIEKVNSIAKFAGIVPE